MRNPPTHTIALVNGRAQVIFKAAERKNVRVISGDRHPNPPT